jgi:hypothetical protein
MGNRGDKVVLCRGVKVVPPSDFGGFGSHGANLDPAESRGPIPEAQIESATSASPPALISRTNPEAQIESANSASVRARPQLSRGPNHRPNLEEVLNSICLCIGNTLILSVLLPNSTHENTAKDSSGPTVRLEARLSSSSTLPFPHLVNPLDTFRRRTAPVRARVRHGRTDGQAQARSPRWGTRLSSCGPMRAALGGTSRADRRGVRDAKGTPTRNASADRNKHAPSLAGGPKGLLLEPGRYAEMIGVGLAFVPGGRAFHHHPTAAAAAASPTAGDLSARRSFRIRRNTRGARGSLSSSSWQSCGRTKILLLLLLSLHKAQIRRQFGRATRMRRLRRTRRLRCCRFGRRRSTKQLLTPLRGGQSRSPEEARQMRPRPAPFVARFDPCPLSSIRSAHCSLPLQRGRDEPWRMERVLGGKVHGLGVGRSVDGTQEGHPPLLRRMRSSTATPARTIAFVHPSIQQESLKRSCAAHKARSDIDGGRERTGFRHDDVTAEKHITCRNQYPYLVNSFDTRRKRAASSCDDADPTYSARAFVSPSSV